MLLYIKCFQTENDYFHGIIILTKRLTEVDKMTDWMKAAQSQEESYLKDLTNDASESFARIFEDGKE